MGQLHSCREYVCPKCGGWLEGSEDENDWSCDTCDYVRSVNRKFTRKNIRNTLRAMPDEKD